jgi:hypothetical protein
MTQFMCAVGLIGMWVRSPTVSMHLGLSEPGPFGCSAVGYYEVGSDVSVTLKREIASYPLQRSVTFV